MDARQTQAEFAKPVDARQPGEREGMINPGDVPWFPAEQFDGYLWGYDDKVFISLIFSRSPGAGHLSKLFNAIWDSGRAVVVPTPFAHMRAILTAKGFAQSFDEENGCELWTRAALKATGG